MTMIHPGDDSNGSHDADDKSMTYGMLGEDHRSEEEKLEKYTGEIGWDYLKDHFETGSLVYVDPSLDLVTVGKAFTDDDAQAVTGWRKTGDIVTPSEPHAHYWEESKTKFLALVVTPFVLIQPVES